MKQKISARYKAAYGISLENCLCVICGGNENLERHHPDYNKPLLVTILSRQCHKQHHRKQI